MNIGAATTKLLKEATQEILRANFHEDKESLYRIFALVLEQARPLIDADLGVVFLQEGGRHLVLKACLPVDVDIESPLPIKSSISGKSLESRQVVIIANLDADPIYSEMNRRYKNLPRMRSKISVPILDGDQALGVLTFECQSVDSFGSSAQNLVEILAGLLAVAIKLSNEVNVREALRQIDLMILGHKR